MVQGEIRPRIEIGQRKFRHIGRDRGIEIELALVDQLHHHRSGEDLGDRADLEDRVRGHRLFGLDARDADCDSIDHTVVKDGDRHPRHIPTSGLALDGRIEGCVVRTRQRPGGNLINSIGSGRSKAVTDREAGEMGMGRYGHHMNISAPAHAPIRT